MPENLCCSVCEALPIPVDLTPLQLIISSRRTIVLGSAPSAQDDLRDAYTGPSDCLICVNGSVAAVSRDTPIDILLLNSRDTDGWDPASKRLHDIMMKQLADRHFKHIVFLMKNKSPQGTINKLSDMGVSWDSHQTVCSIPKIEVCQSVSVKAWRQAFDTSAGVFATCLAIACGGKPMMLCGFSFEDGYCYLPKLSLPNTRKHQEPDKYALNRLALTYPQTLLVKQSVQDSLAKHASKRLANRPLNSLTAG
jgi:hypothetical protein